MAYRGWIGFAVEGLGFKRHILYGENIPGMENQMDNKMENIIQRPKYALIRIM